MSLVGKDFSSNSTALRPRFWIGVSVWLMVLLGWAAWSQWLPMVLLVPLALLMASSSAVICLGFAELKNSAQVVRVSFREGLREPRQTLETMMVLSEHSRRNGLLGLADVETNWAPLAKACQLVALAAEDWRIRQEAQVASQATKQRYGGAMTVLGLCAVCVSVTGVCLFVLSQLGGQASDTIGWVGLAVSLLLVAVVLLPALARLAVARNRDLVCLFIAYEGAINILHDNNMESVYRQLESYIPGGLGVAHEGSS